MEFIYYILQFPIVYSCAPVLLFAFGYYIKQCIETFYKRKIHFYSMLNCCNNNSVTSKTLYELSKLINDIPIYYNMNKDMIKYISSFLESTNDKNLEHERLERYRNLLFFISNKTWFWWFLNPYKEKHQLKQYSYRPRGIYERELGEDVMYKNHLEHNEIIFKFLDVPEINTLFQKYKETNTK